MQKTPIRLIAIDMDGTLLGSDNLISEENAQALRDANAAGIAVAICTGRMVEEIVGYARRADFLCWAAGCNGARVLDPGGKLVIRHDLPDPSARQAVELLLASDLPFNAFYASDMVLIHDEATSPMQQKWARETEERGEVRVHFGEQPLRKALDEGLIKLLAFEDNARPRLAEVAAQLDALAGIDVTSSWSDNREIMPVGVTKGYALAQIAERLGIPRAQVMAIGDHENDRSMLEWAGVSVAMGNATEGIRALCAHRTESCNESGVARAVRRLALGV